MLILNFRLISSGIYDLKNLSGIENHDYIVLTTEKMLSLDDPELVR